MKPVLWCPLNLLTFPFLLPNRFCIFVALVIQWPMDIPCDAVLLLPSQEGQLCRCNYLGHGMGGCKSLGRKRILLWIWDFCEVSCKVGRCGLILNRFRMKCYHLFWTSLWNTLFKTMEMLFSSRMEKTIGKNRENLALYFKQGFMFFLVLFCLLGRISFAFKMNQKFHSVLYFSM